MNKFFRSLTMLMPLALAGCATATLSDVDLIKSYDYSQAYPKPGFALHALLLVVDMRPEVISGQKKASYVGNAFNVFGMPIDVSNADGCQAPHTTHTTERCRPLSESIHNALYRDGDASSSDRLFIIINEWKTEAHGGLKLTYNLAAIVEDKEKHVRAKNLIMGTDENIDTGGIGAIRFSNHTRAEAEVSKIVSGVLARKLETLLSGSVATALQFAD